MKYGRLLEAAFARPDGHHFREWIDACSNSLYSALVYKGGEGWRKQLDRDLNRHPGIRAILDGHDDAALQRLMTNLAGHDMDSVLPASPGRGRPAGLLYAGLMDLHQMETLTRSMEVADGAERSGAANQCDDGHMSRHTSGSVSA